MAGPRPASLIVCLLIAAASPPPAVAEPDAAARDSILAHVDSLYAAAAFAAGAEAVLAGLDRARTAGDDALLLPLLRRRGSHLAAYGDLVGAEPVLREALALADARDDSLAAAQILRWLAVSVSNQGRLDEAEPLTARQIGLARALGHAELEGWGVLARTWYATLRGDEPRAVELARRSAGLFRKSRSTNGEAWACNHLGIALQGVGDYAAAAAAYRRAEELGRQAGSTMIQGMAINNLATLEFSLGDPGRAHDAFLRARDLHAAQGHDVEALWCELNVGYCLLHLGRLPAAAATLEAVADEAAATGQPERAATARLALGDLRRLQGRPDVATRLYRRVLNGPGDIRVALRIEGMNALARTLAARDSLDAALALLERAAELAARRPEDMRALRCELERGRVLLALERPGRARAVLRGVADAAARGGLDVERMEALAAAARAEQALGRPDSALVLLRRAADLWERTRDLPLDPDWREQRGAAGRAIAARLALATLGDTDQPSPGALAAAFAHAQRFKGRTLYERMHGPGTALAAALTHAAVEAPTLDEVQREILRPGELLVDVVVGDDAGALFAVTPDACRAVRLPGAGELASRLRFLRELHLLPAVGEATPAERSALDDLAREIGRLLFGSCRDLVADAERVLLVPDGVVNLLPLASLRVPAAGAEDVLLAQRQVVMVPSTAILAALRRADGEAARTTESRLLALAGGRSADGQRLPAAVAEAAWLRDRYGAATTAAAAPAEWAPYDVLHFAAHASARDDSPWQSSLRLDAGDGAATVRAADIAGAGLGASLVVLAGCESAGGRILSGEGVQGLASAFLGAGGRAVVATLWPVDDRTTRALMRSFYRGLEEGRTVAAALHAARRAIRQEPATEHPFFWAGFVAVGDGDVVVELRPRRRPLPLAAGGLLVLLIAVLVIRRRGGLS